MSEQESKELGKLEEQLERLEIKQEEEEKAPLQKETGLVFDERMKLHKPRKFHPEQPQRIQAIYDEIKNGELLQRCRLIPSREVLDEELLTVHTEDHIKQVFDSKQKAIDREDVVYYGADTYANEHTLQAAKLASGSLIDLTEKVVKGELKNGFAIIRPPGHHAECNTIMGFCLYNNVAIAAKLAVEKFGVKRVLIVDWDVHHGNGTQNMFIDNPSILYFSVHRYDNGFFYPCTGAISDVGKGKGEGFNVNVPWNKPGLGDAEYLACFRSIFLPIALEFDPELVLVSAGFDCAAGDPLGGMKVSALAFGHMTDMLTILAKGKIVIALEGGYNLESISKAAAKCVQVLLGEKPEYIELNELDPNAAQTIAEVIKTHKKYWKCFQTEEDISDKTHRPDDKQAVKSSDEPPKSRDEKQPESFESNKGENNQESNVKEETKDATNKEAKQSTLPDLNIPETLSDVKEESKPMTEESTTEIVDPTKLQQSKTIKNIPDDQKQSFEEQERQRNEWREKRIQAEQERLRNSQIVQDHNKKKDPQKRDKKPSHQPMKKKDINVRRTSKPNGKVPESAREKNLKDFKNGDIQEKSSKMYSLWKSQTQPQDEMLAKKGHPLSRNQSGVRRTGTRPSVNDLHSAIFSLANSFNHGEIVVIPRTRGGFNYAKIDKKIINQHCFFDRSTEHKTILWRVIYNSNGKALCKELPPMYIGKLLVQSKEIGSFKDMESEGSQNERVVGLKPTIKDLDNVVFSSHCIFSADEIVLVPRSAGGFTYGRLVKEAAQICKMSEKTHSINGWRVIVNESDDQANRKDLAAAWIGKIQLFSAAATVEIPSRRAAFANFEQSTHSAELRMKRESEFAEDEIDQEENSEEEEEEEQSPVPLRRRLRDSEEDSEDSEEGEFEEEIVVWHGSNKKSPPTTTPTQVIPLTAESTSNGGNAKNSKVESIPKSPTKTNPSASSKTVELPKPKPDVREITSTTLDSTSQGISVPLQQIGGLLSIDKDELFKRLMSNNKHTSKKHLIVIDGPNVAKKHGKDTSFSSEGIKIVLDYWNRNGHDAIAFLPQHYVKRKPGSGPVTLGEFAPKASNIPMLLDLVEKGKLVLTPPQDYDDTYCIEYAMKHNGCIVTNDRYWDHVDNQKDKSEREKREIKKWLKEHLISFTFVRDEFMPNPNFKYPPLNT